MELQRVGDKPSSLSNAIAFKKKVPNRSIWYFVKKASLWLVLFVLIVGLIAFSSSFIPGKTGIYAPFVVVALPFIVIGFFILNSCRYFTSCKYYETPIKELDPYNDEELMNKCWNKTNKWDEKHDLFDQIKEGYCAFASVNSVLSSIYRQNVYLKYPQKPKPLTLNQMKQLITQNILNDKSVANDFPDINILSVDVHIVDPDNMNLEQFESVFKEMNMISEIVDDDGNTWEQLIYSIANFNRVPLFFCNYGCTKRWMKWVISGHFSPIISFCYDEKNTMYILIADVNKEYGNYLVRSDRLYESMQCREISNKRRGFLKITVQRKLHAL